MLKLQIEAILVDLLVERFAFLLSRLPPYIDAEAFLAEPDMHAEQLRDPPLSRAVGWLEGLADAVDLTVLELFDEVGVAVGAVRPSLPPRGPLRDRDPNEAPVTSCRSCGTPRPMDPLDLRATYCVVCGARFESSGRRAIAPKSRRRRADARRGDDVPRSPGRKRAAAD